MSEFLKELYTLCEKASIPLTDEAAKKMEIYYSLMVETNKQYNITAITQPKEAALKHFFDSIVPIGEIKQDALAR